MLVNAISSFFSPDPSQSLKNTIIVMGLLVIYAACFMLLKSREAVIWAILAWVVVGTAVTLLGVIAALWFDLFGPNFGVLLERFYREGEFSVAPKVQSTLWEPNLYGSHAFTVSIIAFALGRAPEFSTPGWRRFFALAVAAGMSGVMLSMTRTVWLLGPALILLLAAVCLRFKVADLRTVVTALLVPAVIGSAIGLALGLSMPAPRWKMGQPWELTDEQVNAMIMQARGGGSVTIPTVPPAPSGAGQQSGTPVSVGQNSAVGERVDELLDSRVGSLSNRGRIYVQAFEGWTRRPILGWGSGAFPQVYPPPPEGGYWIANVLLHVLFDTGIVGLLIVGAAAVLAAWQGLRALRRAPARWDTIHYALFGLLAAGAGLLIAYQVTDGSYLGLAWVFFAILVAAGKYASQPASEGSATVGRG
jgi:hypothetical protein